MKNNFSLTAVFLMLFLVSANGYAQFLTDSTYPPKRGILNSAHSYSPIVAITDSTLPPISPAHSADSAKTGISWGRVAVAEGTLAAAIVGFHVYQLNAWWAGERDTFHVIEDPSYQADFDKLGHMFGAYYGSHFFQEAYAWSGMDTAQSELFGAISGALWEFYVEIEDGFASGWGFSRGDAKSDIAGATFFLLNKRIPFLQNFEYKWTYWPSYRYLHNQPDIPGQTLNFIEDYSGQSYWLSMNIHGMLPDAAKPYWPSWLNLAVGCSGQSLLSLDFNSPTGNIFDNRKKAWLISVDYDFSKLFPQTDVWWWEFLKRGLDYWHFPAPAYQFYPEKKFFVLFPFQMTIG